MTRTFPQLTETDLTQVTGAGILDNIGLLEMVIEFAGGFADGFVDGMRGPGVSVNGPGVPDQSGILPGHVVG